MLTPVLGETRGWTVAGRGVVLAAVLVISALHSGVQAGAAPSVEGWPAPEDGREGLGSIELRILSAAGGGPLEGLLLTLVGAGAARTPMRGRTGPGGRYRCEDLPSGRYDLFLGSHPDPVAWIGTVRVASGGATRFDIPVPATPLVERLVVRTGDWGNDQTGPSHSRFSRADLASAPAAFGDPMRAVASSAGLAVQNDLKSELRVRGGDPADTAILVDGLPIVHPYHFAGGAGSASTLDADHLAEVRVQAGGFSAEYGDALAGVIDFVTREEPHATHAGRAAVSTIAAQASVAGPAGGGSYLVSGRWSDLGLYQDRVESDVREVAMHDLNAAYRVSPGAAARLDLSVVDAGNRFEQDLGAAGIGTMDGKSRGFRARLEVPLGPESLLRLQLSDGDLESRTAAGGGLRQQQMLARQDVRLSLLRLHGDGHRLQAGLGVSRTRGWMRGDVPDGYDAVASSVGRDSSVAGLFVEDRIRATEWLIVRLGVRADRGPGSRRTFVSPRLGADFEPAPGWTVRAAAGRFVQFTHLDQEFLAAGEALAPQVADHLVLGVERGFGDRLRLAIEGYHKDLHDPIGETVNRFVDYPERLGRFDGGRIRGIDLTLLGSGAGGWRWRVAYGAMRAEQERDGLRSPRNTDQRHAASALIERRLGPWVAGAVLRYASGLPYTLQEPEAGGPAYGKSLGVLNGARLPATARVDLRLSRSVPTARGALRMFVEIINATSRDNVRSIDLIYDEAAGTFYRTTDYQTPLTPVLGVSAEF